MHIPLEMKESRIYRAPGIGELNTRRPCTENVILCWWIYITSAPQRKICTKRARLTASLSNSCITKNITVIPTFPFVKQRKLITLCARCGSHICGEGPIFIANLATSAISAHDLVCFFRSLLFFPLYMYTRIAIFLVKCQMRVTMTMRPYAHFMHLKRFD